MASIKVRQATIDDLDQYRSLQAERWIDENTASHEQLLSRFKTFPEGMLVAEERGKNVGMVFAMRIAQHNLDNPPSWYEITNNGYCDNHSANGNIIFGVDLTTARGVGGRAGDALLIGVGKLAIRRNIKQCMLGGRMPGYHQFKDKMSPEEYLWSKNSKGEFLDRQVKYYSSVPGLRVKKSIPNYFKDPESCDNGVLLCWENPFYNWPYPKFWSQMLPFLIKVQEVYISFVKQLRRLRKPTK